MTDAEIIKALECCLIKECACSECPYEDAEICHTDKMMETVINLFKRQNTEIERLREIVNPKCQKCVYTIMTDAKAEAIKEFADKLDTYIMWHFPIDNPVVEGILAKLKDLVKEMAERQKNDSKEREE